MYNSICGINTDGPLEISNEMSKVRTDDDYEPISPEEPAEGLSEGTSTTQRMRTERKAYNNQWWQL